MVFPSGREFGDPPEVESESRFGHLQTVGCRRLGCWLTLPPCIHALFSRSGLFLPSTVITLDMPLRSCRSFYDEAVEDTAAVRTPTVGDGRNRVAVGDFDVGSDVVFPDGAAPAYTMFDVLEQVASHHLVACALDRLEQNQTYLVVSTCASVDGGASGLRCGASRSVIGN